MEIPRKRTLAGFTLLGVIVASQYPNAYDVPSIDETARIYSSGVELLNSISEGFATDNEFTAESTTSAPVYTAPSVNTAPETFSQSTPETVDAASEDPMPFPEKAAGIYHMMWDTSESPPLSSTPANINVVYLAFAQGDPPSMVGWTDQGEDTFISEADDLRDRGVRMILSLGGAHGHINTSNRQGIVDGVMDINSKVPLDGIDWDVEGSTLNGDDIVWISTELKRLRGSDFAITLAPGGGAIHSYPPVAVELEKAGALDFVGWQFYDTAVSKEDALNRVNSLVSVGIPIGKIGVGMMVDNTEKHWTVEECIDNFSHIKENHPDIGGGFLWEAGRPGTEEWASKVGPLLLK